MSSIGRIVPLFGEGTYGKSAVVTRQRRLNCYFELRKDGDKSKIVCYGTPGLVAKFQLSTPLSLPVRGILGTQSALYATAYNQFQSLSATGTALYSNTLSTSSGQTSMAVNAGATQLVIVDGDVGYLYTPASATFAQIAGSFPNGAKTVTFVSGFFVAEQAGSQYFWVSNANDGSTWNSLAFAAASAYSDRILAVDNLSGILLAFCEQHMEFWQATGVTPVPFTPIQSAANEFGLAAIFSRAHVDQSIIFLAQTREGQAQFVQLKGFNARIISDADIDSLVNSFGTISDAVAMTYEVDTHKFYQVSFPTVNRSLLYDCATGIWCEVQTGASVNPVRHTANLSTYYAGGILVTDYATNQVYTFSTSAYSDNGSVQPFEVITRHILSEHNRIRISSVYLDMETGVGLQSGQGSNPQVMLQYSKDNGRTWSAERWVGLGQVGQYMARVIWRRFGSSRVATFRIRITDPVKRVITNGALKIKVPRGNPHPAQIARAA